MNLETVFYNNIHTAKTAETLLKDLQQNHDTKIGNLEEMD